MRGAGQQRLESYKANDLPTLLVPYMVQRLIEIIQRNKAKLGVRLAETDLAGRIQARYMAALEKALPLKETLARTDKLIDQIVYRLYGLTEEEIKVVEGNPS